jgi:hypothetical protein
MRPVAVTTRFGRAPRWTPDRIASKLLLAHRTDRVLPDRTPVNLTLDGSAHASSWAADIAGVSSTIAQATAGSRPTYDTVDVGHALVARGRGAPSHRDGPERPR